jgi:hypothetical protein
VLSVQTYARLASQYGDDIMTPLAELEDFRKDMEPTLLEKQGKLRSLATDLQVCCILHVYFLYPAAVCNMLQERAFAYCCSTSDRKSTPLYSRHHVATQCCEGHLQGAKMSAAAERKQAERALQKQSQLVAAAKIQERNTADRNRFVQYSASW